MARPVPLDKKALADLASLLRYEIRKAMVGRETLPHGKIVVPGLGRRRGEGPGIPFELRTVRGGHKTVYVMVVTDDGSASSPHYLTSGGYGIYDDHEVVVLKLNTQIAPGVIWRSAEGSDVIEKEAFAMLLHEMTHAADEAGEYKSRARGMTEEEASTSGLPLYLNEGTEVRAYLQEIVHELEPYFGERGLKLKARFGPTCAANMILSLSSTWKWASPYWSRANQQKVIKAVSQRLTEAGFVAGKRP